MAKKNKEEKKYILTKGEVINIYTIIKPIKCGNLSRDAKCIWIPKRIELMRVAEDYDKLLKEASEQTKPEGYDEMTESAKEKAQIEWNKSVRPIAEKWLMESCDIDLKIFNAEDLSLLVDSNPDMPGDHGDFIGKYFLK